MLALQTAACSGAAGADPTQTDDETSSATVETPIAEDTVINKFEFDGRGSLAERYGVAKFLVHSEGARIAVDARRSDGSSIGRTLIQLGEGEAVTASREAPEDFGALSPDEMDDCFAESVGAVYQASASGGAPGLRVLANWTFRNCVEAWAVIGLATTAAIASIALIVLLLRQPAVASQLGHLRTALNRVWNARTPAQLRDAMAGADAVFNRAREMVMAAIARLPWWVAATALAAWDRLQETYEKTRDAASYINQNCGGSQT